MVEWKLWENRELMFPTNTPKTHEALYYRMLFDKTFNEFHSSFILLFKTKNFFISSKIYKLDFSFKTDWPIIIIGFFACFTFSESSFLFSTKSLIDL